jgi:hypothetical protein
MMIFNMWSKSFNGILIITMIAFLDFFTLIKPKNNKNYTMVYNPFLALKYIHISFDLFHSPIM